MKELILVVSLLSGTVGLAQQTPPRKPAGSPRNQDNMPVVPSQGGGSTMPVLKERGNALPMPNGYAPTSETEQREEALRALQSRFNEFKADSVQRRTPPPAPKPSGR